MENYSTSNLKPQTSDLEPSVKKFSIIAETLGKRFNREWIFRKFDYTFKSGETYALTGPNGSGKSTLLQVLWGQVPPSTGTLQYKDNDKEVRPEDFYNHLSIATPYMDLIDELTLAEQLQFHFKLKASRNNLTIDEMIERMYLAPARDKFIVNFSSGMRQRVKLGLAFFTQADIIFLDEPGTNLDKTAFDWYLAQLDALPKECMVLIASNQPSEYPASAHKIDITRYK